MLLFWFLIIAALTYAVVNIAHARRTRPTHIDSAVETAEKRYERGEITCDEYLTILRALRK